MTRFVTQDDSALTRRKGKNKEREVKHEPNLLFFSDYESGNLQQVKPLNDGIEYEISLRPDTLAGQYRNWVFFFMLRAQAQPTGGLQRGEFQQAKEPLQGQDDTLGQVRVESVLILVALSPPSLSLAGPRLICPNIRSQVKEQSALGLDAPASQELLLLQVPQARWTVPS